MPIELRPLKLGELLDRSFSIYRRHVLVFIGIMAAPSITMMLASMPMNIMQARLASLEATQGDPAELLWMFGIAMAISAVLFVLYIAGYMIALGAATGAVSDVYADQTPTVRGAFARVRARLGRVLLVQLLVFLRLFGVALVLGVVAFAPLGLLAANRQSPPSPVIGVLAVFWVMLGMLALFAVVVYFSLRYALGVPIVMIEDVTASASLRRSRALTDGFFWRTFVLAIFAVVLNYVGLLVLQLPFVVVQMTAPPGSSTALWASIGGAVGGALGTMLTSPLLIIGFVVLYYDLRVRKEAFDLDVMLGALGTPASKPSAPPPFVPPSMPPPMPPPMSGQAG